MIRLVILTTANKSELVEVLDDDSTTRALDCISGCSVEFILCIFSQERSNPENEFWLFLNWKYFKVNPQLAEINGR